MTEVAIALPIAYVAYCVLRRVWDSLMAKHRLVAPAAEHADTILRNCMIERQPTINDVSRELGNRRMAELLEGIHRRVENKQLSYQEAVSILNAYRTNPKLRWFVGRRGFVLDTPQGAIEFEWGV